MFTRMCFITSLSDNVRCKGHQTRLQVKRTSRLCLKRKLKSVWKSNAFKTWNVGCVLHFKCQRKIANTKIYEDKRDLYCSHMTHFHQKLIRSRPFLLLRLFRGILFTIFKVSVILLTVTRGRHIDISLSHQGELDTNMFSFSYTAYVIILYGLYLTN